MPTQTHGNSRLEIGWTIAPAVVLAVVMIPTVAMIWDLSVRDPEAMQVTVKGYQWWWGFEYTDEEMTTEWDQPVIAADVLVVPVDTPVQLTLVSEGGGAKDNEGNPDHQVIHSFWAPRLFGKQDAVPMHEGHILFTAEETGTFWGQCAEFCGLQHGIMKFRIVVLDQAAWESWVARAKTAPEAPSDPLAVQGMDLFLEGTEVGQCTACHAIAGEGGTAGPNLTMFADPTHECFAGCDWETDDIEALKAWLRDPGAVKQGAKMPDYGLTEEEIDALVAYLYTLRVS